MMGKLSFERREKMGAEKLSNEIRTLLSTK